MDISLKNFCSTSAGLKLPTIIRLIKVAILPILLYCAPVWLGQNVNIFKDLWYEMLKTATGSTFKPNEEKLQIICSLPPLDLQIKNVIVKFLIKNYMSHIPDLLTKEIENCTTIRGKIFVNQHLTYLKQYIADQAGNRSAHSVQLRDYMYSLHYTKQTIWKFTERQWQQRTSNLEQQTNELVQWPSLIASKTMRINYPRKLEVLLMNLMHGHFPGNKFLWNIGQVTSPQCKCKKSLETAHHIIFECELYNNKRSKHLKDLETKNVSLHLVNTSPIITESTKAIRKDLKALLRHIMEDRFQGEIRLKKYLVNFIEDSEVTEETN